ncbi:MAG: hypothetical protein C4297_05755 [Gemmataceae bacterium]
MSGRVGTYVAGMGIAGVLWAVMCWGTGCGSSPPQDSSAPRVEPRPVEDSLDRPITEPPPRSFPGSGHLKVVRAPSSLGSADYGEEKAAVFVVRNVSKQKLHLEVAEKNCVCTGVEMERTEVEPDGTTNVTLSWIPRAEQEPEREHLISATLQSTDGIAWIRLEVPGTIRPVLHVHYPRFRPELGHLGPQEKRHIPIEVFTRRADVRDLHVEATARGTAQVLATRPLAEERLRALGATCGYRIEIAIGGQLPPGRFAEPVEIVSNVRPDKPLLITFTGFVESGLVHLDPDRVILPNRVSLRRGYRCPPVDVTFYGSDKVDMQLLGVEPAFLKVETKALKPHIWRVSVHVPAGEKEILKALASPLLVHYSRYGWEGGHISFKTTHPDVPYVSIPVAPSQFAP